MSAAPRPDGKPATPAAPTLFYTDARDYVAADVIAEGLALLLDGQSGDRVGVRLIRPHFTVDGQPLLNERREQIRSILGGVFARGNLRRAGELIAELNARPADDPRDRLVAAAVGSWHAYVHAQLVGAPITNRLERGGLGTVRTDGIRAYTTLVIDIDREAGADPEAALRVAYALIDVLVDIGVPRRALLVMQTGRGAYLQIAIEPQPISARPVMKLATRTLARIIEAAEELAHGDESVFDPPRIIRIPGTVNHKPDADSATPAWILQPWTPGVRTPWSVIEKIAAKSHPRPKLQIVPASRQLKPDDDAPTRRPLYDLFKERDWIYDTRSSGIRDVRCPNADQHTDGRAGAILYPPKQPDGPGWFHCSHAHCADLTLFDVYRLLERGV